MKQVTARIKANQDLRKEIENLVQDERVNAGVILSMVGSLKQAVLRFAGRAKAGIILGKLEIVSATGTISKNGCHIHISVSDSKGLTTGGHLSYGCLVRTAVELVILVFDDTEYKRKLDSDTGFEELQVGS